MEIFDFSKFLINKGFTFTNYGIHNLHEMEKNGVNYCLNLQGEVMTCNDSKMENLQKDIPVPKNETEAEQWLGYFLNNPRRARRR